MQERQGVRLINLAVLFGVSVEVVHSLARRGVVINKPGPNCFALLAERAGVLYAPPGDGGRAGNGTERMAQSVERARLEQIAGGCSGAAVRRGVLVDMEGVAAEWSGFCAYWDGKRLFCRLPVPFPPPGSVFEGRYPYELRISQGQTVKTTSTQ